MKTPSATEPSLATPSVKISGKRTARGFDRTYSNGVITDEAARTESAAKKLGELPAEGNKPEPRKLGRRLAMDLEVEASIDPLQKGD